MIASCWLQVLRCFSHGSLWRLLKTISDFYFYLPDFYLSALSFGFLTSMPSVFSHLTTVLPFRLIDHKVNVYVIFTDGSLFLKTSSLVLFLMDSPLMPLRHFLFLSACFLSVCTVVWVSDFNAVCLQPSNYRTSLVYTPTGQGWVVLSCAGLYLALVGFIGL